MSSPFIQRILENDPELTELRLTEAPEAYCTDMSEMISALASNTVIEYVRFDRDFLPCMDEAHQESFFKAVGKLPALKEARIWHASIPVAYLAAFVSETKVLEVLEFGCLDLGGTEADFQVVAEAMKGHPTIQVFHMVDFSLFDDSISMDRFVTNLATIPNLTVVKLEVTHARRSSIVGSEAAAKKVSVTLTGPALATLCRSPKLEALTLNRLNLKLDDFEALAESIKTAPSLKSLALPHCCLDDHGCDTMAKAIGENKTIEKLDFSCNRLTDEGCITIATALRGNTSVKLLRLWGNVKISNAGFDAIAEMLQHNCTLERIPLMAPSINRGIDAIEARPSANRAA